LGHAGDKEDVQDICARLESIYDMETLCLQHKESRQRLEGVSLELPGALGTPALPQSQFFRAVLKASCYGTKIVVTFFFCPPRLGIFHVLTRCASSSCETPAAHLTRVNSAFVQNPGAPAVPDM